MAGSPTRSMVGATRTPRETPELAGKRGFDIVIVFPYKCGSGLTPASRVRFGDDPEEIQGNLKEPDAPAKNKMKMWEQKRNGIFKSLQNCGLTLSAFYSRDRDEIFCKIGTDVEKLRDVAEMTKYPLQMKDEYLGAYGPYRRDFPGRAELNYQDRKIVSHLYKNHTDEDSAYPSADSIFRTVDRIRILDRVIRSKDKGCAGIDIGSWMKKGDVIAYFPTHEPQKLREMWDDPMAWITMPYTHIEKVRDYFGEKVAFYFLWMSFLIKWLVVPSALGATLTLLDLLDQTPDNMTVVPFCIFMGVWAAFLSHFWRRTEAKYAQKWGVLNIAEELEPCRPEFFGEPRINPVTERVDLFYPWSSRIWAVLRSYTTIILSLIILAFVVAGLFIMRHIAHNSVPYGRLGFQIANAFIVEVLNIVFSAVCRWLNDAENHRTERDYEMHLLAKSMAFKFINSYQSLYYIAFFKRHSYLFGMEMDCMKDDCLLDLSQQLGIFVIFRFTFQNLVEVAWPKFLAWWRGFAEGASYGGLSLRALQLPLADMSSAELQAKREEYREFEDFDEVLITYGYTSIFVVASPWVPIVVLLGFVLEVYLDAYKLVNLYRRPFPVRIRSNEPWDTAFDVMGIIAMFTNVALVVFASSQFTAWTNTEKIMCFFMLEHLIIFARVAVKLAVPEMPERVVLANLKHDHLVHKYLDCVEEEEHSVMKSYAYAGGGSAKPEIYDRDDEDEEED